MPRIDALDKATGRTRYVADVTLPGMAYAAVARSPVVHARIINIDVDAAKSAPGVIGVFTSADVSELPYGRALEDAPILAREKVRYLGERVAAVVAETPSEAEAAAALIEVDYEDLRHVTTLGEALASGAPLVHDEPWNYPGAAIGPDEGPNLQFHSSEGSRERVEKALASAAHTIERSYVLQSVHQGYLEPQACVAEYLSAAKVNVWFTNKVPHRFRTMLAHCLEMDAEAFAIQPIALGGDFGGKGAPGEAPLCIELSRLVGRPVKLVLRYTEDLIATNPRHPAEITVRMGCDQEGHFLGVAMDVRMNCGAYGGCTPSISGAQSGSHDLGSYRIPEFFSEYRRVYTNTVPRGYMRAPGGAQGVFAFESAIDELANEVGLDPVQLRRINLLSDDDADVDGHKFAEQRGLQTLDAAIEALELREAPPGWLHATGLALYSRGTPRAPTSLRLVPKGSGIRVEIPVVETGTGSHTVMQNLIAEQLGYDTSDVEVVQVSTDDLPTDTGVGGSRVTATMALAVDLAAKQWGNRLRDEPLLIEVPAEYEGPNVRSYVVQIAQVAVDPETGELRVLELLTAVDVASIVNPRAHQMQVDGGTVMGFGYGCLEDLDEADGHVWAANLGEFKLPSSRDVPRLRTVLVRGALGLGTANVKSIGEGVTPPVAPAIANALFAATGCRVRELPLTAERIYFAMRGDG